MFHLVANDYVATKSELGVHLSDLKSRPDSSTVTRYIHVRHTGSPVRIFRETTV